MTLITSRKTENIILKFDCLDTIAKIYLNGEEIAQSKNYFVPKEIDISGKLKEDNELKVQFACPVQYVKDKQEGDKMPRNSNGLNGIPHIRKPGCHFGWDWGPALPTVGIAGDVSVLAYDGARLKDIEITQTHKDGKVILNIESYTEGVPKEGGYTEISVKDPDGNIIANKSLPAENVHSARAEITVENPLLWWTADISGCRNQPLYTVSAKLSQGEQSDEISKKVGLRTIQLDTGKDEYGSNFRFILNGKPLFIKGGNYIPPDALLTRADKNTYKYLLGAMCDANMNCVRVWGGGRYEKEEFYDICDRLGILVWQDFMFACQPYPFYNDELLSEIIKEVECNVKRLRHRACLALWCGNNEIEVMSPAWATYAKLREWTEKFFYHLLPDELRKWDKITPYIPGSPYGVGYLDKTASDNYGDTHLWSVWHGLQPLTYYRKRMTRFCSEFGLESIPDTDTVEVFCPPEQKNLTSDVMKAHQKCLSGNDKIIYYISTRFRIPEKFDDLIYLSQITQSECVRDATEHWRRNRGRCNGSIYWQLNDCWPVM
ncbi:MAG: glycoside hydrolase family 2 protein, partial [Clostridia bacterium]|nr:glycoside hydrolase family 2 protein [Clostridia bacterium]